ncbi:MAG: sigma-70 family RNA polymerase sigma factor [Bacteroidales bacterium]|jgi:RNA polymerase sigma-70 factor (ECF subfamily)|nr:sigma-70 family RNA polymerase sigma factor [Bacteroidales bacterium]
MEISVSASAKAKRDYELICKAREKGDQKAYAELMELYREPIYYMILKMIKSTTDADDLTIESFGKAFKSIDKYTPEYAFSTWLFRIATNNCVDFLRKKKNRISPVEATFVNNPEQEMLEFNAISETLSPEEAIMEEQKRQLLRDVVQKLKPHYKELIEKRYFEEKSYEEISQELNIPIGTVKAKLFRAREFLYNLVKNNSDL